MASCSAWPRARHGVLRAAGAESMAHAAPRHRLRAVDQRAARAVGAVVPAGRAEAHARVGGGRARVRGKALEMLAQVGLDHAQHADICGKNTTCSGVNTT